MINNNKLKFLEKKPSIDNTVFIANGSKIIGDVVIKKKSSVWFNCTLRADVNFIRIGERTNIQDGTVIHVSSGGFSATGGKGCPTIIGDNVTIGHNATIHACSIKSNSLIGMGAIVLDNAIVHEYSFVAAGCLIPPNSIVNSYELWAGNPGKVIRKLKKKEIYLIDNTPLVYNKLAKEFLKKGFRM